MKKKKGFTLIELLAVIVVLAIIALIATPIVLNLIEKSRKGAFTRSAENVLRSAKLSYSKSVLLENGPINMEYYCDDSVCLSELEDENGKISLDVTGNMGEGNVYVYGDGKITFTLTNGKYCAVKFENEDKINVLDGDCGNVDISKTTAPEIESIASNSVTTSSARIVVAPQDSSAVKGYSYSVDGGEFTEILSSNIYDITGLTQSTTHTVVVRMYNKLPDKIGYNEATDMVESSAYAFTTLGISRPTITVSNYNIYTQVKTVTISYDDAEGISHLYNIKDKNGEIISTEQVTTSPVEIQINDNEIYVEAISKDAGDNQESISTYIDTIDTTDPTAVGYTYTRSNNSLKIIATATDAQSGIYSFEYSIDGGTNWVEHIVNSSSTSAVVDEYTASVTSAGDYTIMVRATNNANHNTPNASVSGITTTAGASACTLPTYTLTPSAGTWSQAKTVTINAVNGYTASYSVDGGDTFTQGNSVTLTSEGSVIGMLSNGTSTCKSVQEVSNIDTSAPTNLSYTHTRDQNSITIRATATDAQSGIYSFEYSIDGGTNWTEQVVNSSSTSAVANEYVASVSSTESYTIMVRATNIAYHNTSNPNGLQGIATASETSACALPTYTLTPVGDSWSQAKTVTINAVNGYTASYSVDGGDTFTQGNSVTLTSEGSVVGMLSNGTSECKSVQEVSYIDTSAPTAVGYTYTRDQNSITIRATATDAQSGIYSFEYSIDGGTNWTEQVVNSLSTSAVVDEYVASATSNGSYTLMVRATNNAYHNTSNPDASQGVTTTAGASACTIPTYTLTPLGDSWSQAKTVTINSVNGYTASYSVDGGTTFTQGNSVTLTSEGSVVGMLSNGTSECKSVQEVSYIDTTKPTDLNISYTKDSNYIHVTASAKDAQSGIYSFEYSIDGTNWIEEVTNSTSTSTINSQHIFSSLSTGTYNVYVKVINRAYNNTSVISTYQVPDNGVAEISENGIPIINTTTTTTTRKPTTTTTRHQTSSSCGSCSCSSGSSSGSKTCTYYYSDGTYSYGYPSCTCPTAAPTTTTRKPTTTTKAPTTTTKAPTTTTKAPTTTTRQITCSPSGDKTGQSFGSCGGTYSCTCSNGSWNCSKVGGGATLIQTGCGCSTHKVTDQYRCNDSGYVYTVTQVAPCSVNPYTCI